MTHAGIVLAAGSGTRVGNSRNKVYLPLAGRRIVTWSLELLRRLPGIGRLVIQSIQSSDFAVVECIVFLLAVVFVVINFVVDVLYSVINPRVRLQ